jgi:hypothetical protein
MGQAFKYVRLKQLLSLHLADVHQCKRALLSKGWNLQRAADHLLTSHRPLSAGGDDQDDDLGSPESLEV